MFLLHICLHSSAQPATSEILGPTDNTDNTVVEYIHVIQQTTKHAFAETLHTGYANVIKLLLTRFHDTVGCMYTAQQHMAPQTADMLYAVGVEKPFTEVVEDICMHAS